MPVTLAAMPTRATPFDPAMKFSTAPIPAALGYLNPAT
jgi:hypothetical protein